MKKCKPILVDWPSIKNGNSFLSVVVFVPTGMPFLVYEGWLPILAPLAGLLGFESAFCCGAERVASCEAGCEGVSSFTLAPQAVQRHARLSNLPSQRAIAAIFGFHFRSDMWGCKGRLEGRA